jgi:hypothetical protein
MVKKIGLIVCALFLILTSLTLISATLEITKTAVSTLAIKDLNKPAMFDITFKNTGSSDTFALYSTVGLTLMPNESFDLASGESKTISLSIYPTMPLKISPDYISFEYKIKDKEGNVQIDELAIGIANLKDALEFTIDPINPDSDTATVHINNKYGGNIENLELEFSSLFFSESEKFSLGPLEKKEIQVTLDKNKIKELLAGPYIVNAKIVSGDVSAETSTILKYEDKTGIETKESSEGIFLHRQEISKYNKGNLKTEASIIVTRNLISALFTTTNVDPTRKEFSRFHVSYIYQKQLSPGESLDVVIKTNWWILVLVIVAIIFISYLFNKYIKEKIIIRKRVSLVRTKGGEFALKVTLNVKARDHVERIRLVDRLPPMVKVFDGYGLTPEKLDERNRRLEWNIQSLAAGEERTFNYIIYSKVGLVGRFELPKAEAIYEFEGNLKEARSNEAFFSNGASSN